MKSVADFLFGKDPDIFDEQGRIRHRLPEEKWQRWDSRIKESRDYDWRHHGAKERAATGKLDQTKK